MGATMTDHHVQTIRHFGHLAPHYDHRHRHYNQQTLSRAVDTLALPQGGRLLDVGCGTGEFERLVQSRHPQATLVGVDVTPEMIAQAREKFRDAPRVTFHVAEAEAVPFEAASFDAVVSCNMLHHVRAVEAALREWARVLRPGGQLVLVDWSRDFYHARLAHYYLRLVKRSYVKMYRATELIKPMVSVGLTVEHVQRFFVPPYFGMMRLVATKQAAPS